MHLFPFHQDQLVMAGADEGLSFMTEINFARLGCGELERHTVSIPGMGLSVLVDLESPPGDPESPLKDGAFVCKPLRSFFPLLSPEQTKGAVTALMLLKWLRGSRFCMKCAAPLGEPLNDNSRKCTRCETQYFPPITPAVIVLVHREGKALLAHNVNFAAGMYSAVAGFVEPGETLEECVAREVREETGIEIRDIRYFASQPWPFPHSIMVGFTAEYAGGTIAPDGVEIEDAGWFPPDGLPSVPPPGSVSRKLIDWFLETHGRHE